MAEIGRPEREIEVRPVEDPFPRELPSETPAPAPRARGTRPRPRSGFAMGHRILAGAPPLEARSAVHGPRPAAHHVCRIHAFSARDEALTYLECGDEAALLFAPGRERPARHRRLSRLRRGRAVTHERAWRSQFAYPYDLYLLRGDRALAPALVGRYAVETSPFPPDT